MQGRIHEVAVRTVGSTLFDDQNAGDSSIGVTSAADFSGDGADIIVIDGAQYTITSRTDAEVEGEPDLFGISPPLAAFAEAGTTVALFPVITEKVALVLFDDGEEAPDVLIPYEMSAQLPEGIRAPEDRENVEVEENSDGELVVTELLATPAIDGSYVVPPADLWGGTSRYDFDTAIGNINDDIAQANADVASGGSTIASAINKAVSDFNTDITAEQNARSAGDTANSDAINNAINDYNAKIATKSKHTLSSAAPTTADAGNAGDVWERYETVSGNNNIIGRWRLMNSASPYSWQAMALDRTYIPQIDIGSGTFGDLSGARLLVNSVGTEKLVIADFNNLVKDPQFKGIGTWSVSNGAFTVGQSVSVGPSGGAETVARTTATAGRVDQIIENQGTTVVPGQEYYLGVYARYQTVAPNAGTFYVGIQWRDSTDTIISTTYVVQQAATVLTGAWQKFEGSVVAPQGAATCTPVVRLSSTWNTGPLVDFGQMTIRRKHGGELVVDGSIKTINLAADAVDATVIKASSIGVKQLIVTNFDNLVGDPRFSKPLDDPNGWSSSGGAAELSIVSNSNSTADGPTLTAGPGSTQRFPVWGSAALKWDVEPGSAFRVRARFLTTAAEAANTVGISIRWFATDGTFADTSVMYGVTSTAGAWQEVAGTLNCPTTSGKTYHKAYIFLRINARTGTIRFEQVSATRAGDANLIVDGSILARHVTSDMVEGLLVTGRVLQTTTTAQRGIKISTSGLIGYNTSGLVSILIDPTTGALTTASGTGQRVTMRNDGSGGIIEFFSGISGETLPSVLDPYSLNGLYNYLELRSGTTTTATEKGMVRVASGPAGSSLVTLQAANFYVNNATGGQRLVMDATSLRITRDVAVTGKLDVLQGDFTLANPYNIFSAGTYNATVTASANVFITAAYKLVRSTSLGKYKIKKEELTGDMARGLLELTPKTWFDRGEWTDNGRKTDGLRRIPGLVAEEVEKHAPLFATYDDNGLTGVAYDRVGAALIPLVREALERIEALERSVA